MIVEITSRDNQIIKDTIKLKNNAKDRREERKYFIEGARLCGDALESDVSIYRLFYTDNAHEKYQDIIFGLLDIAQEVYQINDDVSQKLSDTVHPQGIFCVCHMREALADLDNPGSGQFVALENIQDPSNMGTILRTAEALGFTGAMISKDSCDIYNTKVIRGSMGAVFRLPIHEVENFPEMIKILRAKGLRPLAAVPDNDASRITAIRFFKGVIMCIGNEGSGLTQETIAACGERVTIPMNGRAESLNAAIAASILMWEMVRMN